MRGLPTPMHMAVSVTRALVTHPSTNQARRCLPSHENNVHHYGAHLLAVS